MALGHGNPPYREAPGGWPWHGGPPTRNGPRGASKSLDLVYGQPRIRKVLERGAACPLQEREIPAAARARHLVVRHEAQLYPPAWRIAGCRRKRASTT